MGPSSWGSVTALALTLACTSSACTPSAEDADDSDVSSTSESALQTKELPGLVIDRSGTTVSGLSSGAFMAVQMHVAYAREVHGAAVFAGGPFLCAGGNAYTATTTCMAPAANEAPSARIAIASAKSLALAGLVDSTSALAGSRVYLYGGDDDKTVAPAVMDSVRDFYSALAGDGGLSTHLHVPGTGHVLPTLDSGDTCDTGGTTYLGKCGVDGAGDALEHLYGKLEAPSTTPKGRYLRFSQSPYASFASGMAESGYAYVPASCARGETCRIHVAFHGCKQYATGPVGERFVRQAGYARWADTNRIVVLFPQTTASAINPNGCWDWWGYTGPFYATQLGPQIAAIHRMIVTLSSGESKPD